MTDMLRHDLDIYPREHAERLPEDGVIIGAVVLSGQTQTGQPAHEGVVQAEITPEMQGLDRALRIRSQGTVKRLHEYTRGVAEDRGIPTRRTYYVTGIRDRQVGVTPGYSIVEENASALIGGLMDYKRHQAIVRASGSSESPPVAASFGRHAVTTEVAVHGAQAPDRGTLLREFTNDPDFAPDRYQAKLGEFLSIMGNEPNHRGRSVEQMRATYGPKVTARFMADVARLLFTDTPREQIAEQLSATYAAVAQTPMAS